MMRASTSDRVPAFRSNRSTCDGAPVMKSQITDFARARNGDERSASGFDADWQVLDLNRRLAQQWRESEAPGALVETSFGITLTQPAGSYQQNVRAGKYGVLFIALTFVAFFLFEVLRGLRVHPVQYLLVGAALCTF